jgi:hypothetical protein
MDFPTRTNLLAAGGTAVAEDEVVEIPLLLPGWQMTALESAARGQGLTTAQMVRRLIRDFCRGETLRCQLHAFGEG